jgi:rhodanese-related sulfurtransferase
MGTVVWAGNESPLATGDSLFIKGEYQRATQAYEKGLAAAPDNVILENRLRKAILVERGDLFLSTMTREVQKKGDVRINAKTLVARKIAGEKITLIDVRTPQEQTMVVAVGALLIPMDQVIKNLDKIPMDSLVVVVCHSSPRAVIVTTVLRMLGYDKAYALKGGIMAIADINAKKAPDNLR